MKAEVYEGHDVIVVIVKKRDMNDYDATVAAIKAVRGES